MSEVTPKAREFLDYVASLNRPPVETMPLDEMRAIFEETFARLGGAPVDVGAVRDVEAPGPRGPVPVRVYTPYGATPERPLFVYIHGGGWVCGSRDSYDAVCRLLTRESGCVVASVDYRRAPEHPAPEPFEDCWAALQWLAAHAADVGADASCIAIGGDSAGGGLAASVAIKARDAGAPRIAHQMLIYPAVTSDESTESFRLYGENHFLTRDRIAFYERCYVPRRKLLDNPYVKAMSAKTLRGLPPATIILAECDPLHDMGVAYAQRLRDDGVPVDVKVYPGMIHAFFSFIALFEEGRNAVTYAGRAVGNALGTASAEAR